MKDPNGVWKVADVNFDGVPDKISWREFLDGYAEFIDFGEGTTRLHRDDSSYETGVNTFQTSKLDLKVAAQSGAKLFGVGEAVQLLDGRSGKIEGFTFIFDKNYENQDTRVEILIDGAKNLIDVSLLDIIPQKK